MGRKQIDGFYFIHILIKGIKLKSDFFFGEKRAKKQNKIFHSASTRQTLPQALDSWQVLN